MRPELDVAILCPAANRNWFEPLKESINHALSRIMLHEVIWQGASPMPLSPSSPQPIADLTPDVLARSILAVRRYDAILLPISLETLAWTRQCLAAIPRGQHLALLGVAKDLVSGALLDLMALGLTDYVTLPVNAAEFRARVIAVVARAPRPIALREQSVESPLPMYDPRQPNRLRPTTLSQPTSHPLAQTSLNWDGSGFAQAKKKVMQAFERQYLTTALQRANGRITVAARHAKKDRRAFWELLRKHDLLRDLPKQRRRYPVQSDDR
jgi:DNA-binding response OmpR family regulator